MGKLIFVLGGAQSGKSRIALNFAKNGKGKSAFVATCLPVDREMNEKIKRHREERPKNWSTVEAGNTPFAIKMEKGDATTILIDSLTLWAARCVEKNWNRKEVEERASAFAREIKEKFARSIVVSDEVGLSIVPDVKSARKFRTLLGSVNQIFAREAENFYVVFAGVPVCVKK